jgi:hypothetical protein
MLVFLDESFRTNNRGDKAIPLGVLSGVAIDERQLTRIAKDIYNLKYKHFGAEFAKDQEIKGTTLLKRHAFKIEITRNEKSRNLELARDIVRYLIRKRIPVFGCVCFQQNIQTFKCENETALDKTFRFLFERLDMFMKIEAPDQMAALVFDDRDHGTNTKNATAITNFFLRSPDGLALDSILDTPFFGISQAQNIGLQLADFVTTIIAMRFEGRDEIKPIFQDLKKGIYRWHDANGIQNSGLKVIRIRT